jgi:uncharacterized sodium:solute symporter family permease YidK
MSRSGFAIGMAISSYEWMAARTLIIAAIFIIPMYLKNKIYIMPQFLARRYSDTVSTSMAVLWLLVYVFVNLISIIYLVTSKSLHPMQPSHPTVELKIIRTCFRFSFHLFFLVYIKAQLIRC